MRGSTVTQRTRGTSAGRCLTYDAILHAGTASAHSAEPLLTAPGELGDRVAKLLWTLKQHVGPRPRAGHGMAYDSQAGRTLLFGGQFFQAARLGDTWQWYGENWTQLDDIGPPPRSELAMVYDPGRQRTVLFGDTSNGTAVHNDTWEWNGEDWTQVADSGPAARQEHAMVFDTARNRTLLFGGLGDDRGSRRHLGMGWQRVGSGRGHRTRPASVRGDGVRHRARSRCPVRRHRRSASLWRHLGVGRHVVARALGACSRITARCPR
jgi:hypothetical protein